MIDLVTPERAPRKCCLRSRRRMARTTAAVAAAAFGSNLHYVSGREVVQGKQGNQSHQGASAQSHRHGIHFQRVRHRTACRLLRVVSLQSLNHRHCRRAILAAGTFAAAPQRREWGGVCSRCPSKKLMTSSDSDDPTNVRDNPQILNDFERRRGAADGLRGLVSESSRVLANIRKASTGGKPCMQPEYGQGRHQDRRNNVCKGIFRPVVHINTKNISTVADRHLARCSWRIAKQRAVRRRSSIQHVVDSCTLLKRMLNVHQNTRGDSSHNSCISICLLLIFLLLRIHTGSMQLLENVVAYGSCWNEFEWFWNLAVLKNSPGRIVQ